MLEPASTFELFEHPVQTKKKGYVVVVVVVRAIDTGSPHHLSIHWPVNNILFVAGPILVCAKKFIHSRLFC
jgi:hypothetical protein